MYGKNIWIYENRKTPFFSIEIFTVTYLDGQIVTAESATENDAQDPSEGLDWNWKNYE